MTAAADPSPAAERPRDASGALAVIRAHGLRLTGARRHVLEALFAAGRPASANELAAALDGVADPASVYRNLETLERVGLVRHVHLGHGAGLYELAGSEAREYAYCERCGRLVSVPAAELDRARTALERVLGIEPRFGHFPLAGLCRRCRGEDGKRSGERRIHARS